MVQCPKCKEAIGDNLTICPLCRHEFTQAEKGEMAKEIRETEEKLRNAEKEMLLKFNQKRSLLNTLLVIAFISLIAVPFLTYSITKSITGLIIAFAVVCIMFIAVIVTGIVSRAFFCPYCDTLLFRNYGDHCTHCGKKIY